MLTLTDALLYISGQNQIHGDIKPGNILVSTQDSRLRAFIGDFGLTGKSGGTPRFMAPEGLDKNSRIVGKTDLYSFAVTVLFTMFSGDLAIKLLFFPIAENLDPFVKSLSRFPLLRCILESLRSDPETRIDFDSWSIAINDMKNLDKNLLMKKINSQALLENGVHLDILNQTVEKEGGLYFYILEHFGFEISSSKVNENEAYRLSKAISYIENDSMPHSKRDHGTVSDS